MGGWLRYCTQRTRLITRVKRVVSRVRLSQVMEEMRMVAKRLGVAAKPKLAPTEAQESLKLVQWCDLKGLRIVHIPNEGQRSLRNGWFMRKIGLRSGFPDYVLFVQRGGFGGLAIELKRLTNSNTSDEQKHWIAHLNEMGYKAVICKGADAAIAVIEEYLKGETKEQP